jgi:hypothetical protein
MTLIKYVLLVVILLMAGCQHMSNDDARYLLGLQYGTDWTK